MKLAVVLARSGSKGVPNKNIEFVGTRRLSHIPLEACLKSKAFDLVVYASDSSEYLDLAGSFVESLGLVQTDFRAFERSGSHSTDLCSSWDSVKEVILGLDLPLDTSVILAGGSCAGLDFADASFFVAHTEQCHSAMSITELGYPVENTFLNYEGFYARHELSKTIPARQQAMRVLKPDGYLYRRSAHCIVNNKLFPDEQTMLVDLKKSYYLNVDSPHDLNIAKALLSDD